MKTIFLIANNPNISQIIYNRCSNLQVDNKSIIVRFNHVEKRTRSLFNSRTDILFLRYNANPPLYYHGLGLNGLVSNLDSSKIYLIGGSKKLYTTITNKYANHFLDKESVDRLWKVKSASSGLVAITYFLDRFPDYKIILVGFNFHKDQRTLRYHNFAQEEFIIIQLIENNYPIEIWN